MHFKHLINNNSVTTESAELKLGTSVATRYTTYYILLLMLRRIVYLLYIYMCVYIYIYIHIYLARESSKNERFYLLCVLCDFMCALQFIRKSSNLQFKDIIFNTICHEC